MLQEHKGTLRIHSTFSQIFVGTQQCPGKDSSREIKWMSQSKRAIGIFDHCYLRLHRHLWPNYCRILFWMVWFTNSLKFLLCRRRWGLQEGDQGHSGSVRQNPAGRRSASLRAQEVRRSRCPCSLPEVVPLNYSVWFSIWIRAIFYNLKMVCTQVRIKRNN